MKPSRFTEEQIIEILREQEVRDEDGRRMLQARITSLVPPHLNH